ncbi:hypothetical protein [Hyalangium versicolor]|uniref:hypothetical protein n=1 Tax=Hyalangium versicolor TaxID=2861190 RepID=UPI001CCC3FD4|nr:hypothetical protein [Hyalangium versicolor]
MRTRTSRHLLLAAGLLSFTALAAAPGARQPVRATVRDASGSQNDLPRYFTSPAPIFQRGNQLSQSLPDNHPQVQSFLDFYSKQIGIQIPALSRSKLAPLPPRYLDIADNGGNASSGNFNTSLVCQSCHDSDWKVTGQALPNMSFWAQGFHSTNPNYQTKNDIAANWSLFGDWSASIKALAGRDPVFLAQVESTRQLNSTIPPIEIDNLCLRCHSPLGQRQAEKNGQKFSHSMLYATPPGSGFTNPLPDDPLAQSQYATYGALGRDGISCSACHSVAPDKGLPWDGSDFSVFYGNPNQNVFGNNVSNRIKKAGDTTTPPPFPFTSSMTTHPGSIVGPDTGLNTAPMSKLGLNLATASTQPSPANPTPDSYLRDATVCGSCHAVILPQVPTTYGKGVPIPSGYKGPASCDPAAQKTFTGDYLTDPCVGLDYEQTTYFEWLNSGYASGTATCLTCHMQIATTQDAGGNLNVAQYNSDLAQFYGSNTQLTPRQYNRHTLLGINLFVHEMFQQFSDVLGVDFYKQDDSVVPPYLQQRQPSGDSSNLVPNPGAEDGNAKGWTGSIQAATQVWEPNLSWAYPYSGKYFFTVQKNALLSVDLTPFAKLIDAGGVQVSFTGYVRCDDTPCGGSGTNLAFQVMGPGIAPPPFTISPVTVGYWSSPPFLLNPLAPGARSIQITVTAPTPVSVDNLGIQLVDADRRTIPVYGGDPQQAPRNYVIAQNLLNAEQSIVDLALNQAQGQAGVGKPAVQVAINSVKVDGKNITAKVTVTNNAGHKFPSGAPFRRAFLQFELLDQYGAVLWASGQPNAYGAICDGPCNSDGTNILESEFTTDRNALQPHRQTIRSQDQVQIYELRAADDSGVITSRELQIFEAVKDNRILPRKWVPPSARKPTDTRLGLNLQQMAQLTMPRSSVPGSELSTDPNYTTLNGSGVDQVTYTFPLPQGGTTPTWIRVRMNYQSVPPGYLAARFKEAVGDLTQGKPGPAMQRLIYMTSRLNLDLGLKDRANPASPRDLVENWTMVLGEAVQPLSYAQPPR